MNKDIIKFAFQAVLIVLSFLILYFLFKMEKGVFLVYPAILFEILNYFIVGKDLKNDYVLVSSNILALLIFVMVVFATLNSIVFYQDQKITLFHLCLNIIFALLYFIIVFALKKLRKNENAK